MVAAAATGGDLLITNVIPKHMESVSAKLIEMGVNVEEFDDSIRISRSGPLSKIAVKTLPYPGFPTDMQPQIAVCMALANGTSIVTETIFESRFKFLDELRSLSQVIIVSDTFTQFAQPLMKKLGMPTIFCNELVVNAEDQITGFRMRVENSKFTTVKHLQAMGFDTIAAGDSFNDLGMIAASKAGFLFRSTEKIKADYPQHPAYATYEELLSAIKAVL